MPTLPTLTATQKQIDTMLAVYGSAEVYLQWLGKQIAGYVAEQGRQFYVAEAETKTAELVTLFEGFGETP